MPQHNRTLKAPVYATPSAGLENELSIKLLRFSLLPPHLHSYSLEAARNQDSLACEYANIYK